MDRRWLRILMAGLCLLLTAVGGQAANYTWVGNGSNDDWDTIQNWVGANLNPPYPDDTGDNGTISGIRNVNLIRTINGDPIAMGHLTLSGTVILGDADGNDPVLQVQKLTITGATGGTTIKIKQMATLETD